MAQLPSNQALEKLDAALRALEESVDALVARRKEERARARHANNSAANARVHGPPVSAPSPLTSASEERIGGPSEAGSPPEPAGSAPTAERPHDGVAHARPASDQVHARQSGPAREERPTTWWRRARSAALRLVRRFGWAVR